MILNRFINYINNDIINNNNNDNNIIVNNSNNNSNNSNKRLRYAPYVVNASDLCSRYRLFLEGWF